MRASTAYLAGGGTVILAIVVGIGGGLIMGNMVAPQSPKQGVEQTKLERQKSPEPIQAAAGPSQPVPYLATTQARTEAVTAPPTQPQPDSNSAATPAPPVQSSAVTPSTTPVSQPATASVQPAAAQESRGSAPEEKHTAERRKPERRQQWVESRRRRQQQDLRAVEESVRADTETRAGREFTAEPVRIETPQIRLFGTE